MSLITTRSTLMHAALAHISPELRELDLLIASGNLPRSLPTEVLLSIRARLLPILIAHLTSTSTAALQRYELSLRRLVCPQCTIYNEFVYGDDVWNWNLHGPCSCLPASTSPSLNPKQFRDRDHWLEAHLSREASSTTIWDDAARMLCDFGCEVMRRDADAGPPARDSVIVVPKADTDTDPEVLFRRLERDLGLRCDYASSPPPPPFLDTREVKVSVSAPPSSTVVTPHQILDTVIAPLSAVFVVFYTVICYYCTPGALRLL